MIPVARIGDRTYGVCQFHGPKGGTIVSGSSDHTTNSRSTARLGDRIVADCGHGCTIITGSPTHSVNTRAVARLGDLGGADVYHCNIVTGSPDTFSG